MATVLCGIGSGVDYNCLAKKRISGVKKVWLYNLDLLSSPVDPNGFDYVQGLEFTGYDGLYLFDAGKFSHSATSTPNKNTDSGTGTFLQSVTLRLFPDTPTELKTISDLLVSDVGAIVLTNNNEFRIYGAQNGLSGNSDGAVNPTGRLQGEDVTTSITIVGEETLPYRILLRTDYATTLAYVTALQF
jgi:hypothetical protein